MTRNRNNPICVASIDIEGAKIDCLSLFMCPLLAQLKTGFFSCFSDAAVYSTNKQTRQALSSLYSYMSMVASPKVAKASAMEHSILYTNAGKQLF